ncbi:SRPBCC family protein [Cohnella candidum]|uniref:SRPBCC family protein n=1 Tax=Cohnella candidum TaxID=2674991 RepID=A0A3G3JW63_9BACL|nr:SRPBCC family protein [Cohnella candidum]AYQ72466.1 hypothetical protein EAV92_07735 [Cohnella candidum]
MNNKKAAIWKGIIAANLLALVCLGATTALLKMSTGEPGMLILSEFVILPMIMGIVNAYFWRSHGVTAGPSFGYGFLNLIISLVLSAFFMGEGVNCLIIVAPLIYTFLMLGILFGHYMFKRNKNTLNIGILAVFMSVFVANLAMTSPSDGLATDKIVIKASPEKVWQNVVSFPAIDAEPTYWLFKIGLPSPVQSVAEGNYVGASRQCIFSNGAVFEERIVEYEPNKKLTFEITKQPDDPEIIGHLNLLKGQFILEDNGDGTTTLIGNSWYDLKIKPSQYFDVWTQSVIRNVHVVVMEHIKQLSEQA